MKNWCEQLNSPLAKSKFDPSHRLKGAKVQNKRQQIFLYHMRVYVICRMEFIFRSKIWLFFDQTLCIRLRQIHVCMQIVPRAICIHTTLLQ